MDSVGSTIVKLNECTYYFAFVTLILIPKNLVRTICRFFHLVTMQQETFTFDFLTSMEEFELRIRLDMGNSRFSTLGRHL